MSASAEFAEYVAELLQSLGRIQTKRMFGGAGVYCNGVMIALIADDTLYLKVDAHNRDDFEAAGMSPFEYIARGKIARMNYYRAPDDAMDSPALMQSWARGALAAALRARSPKSTNAANAGASRADKNARDGLRDRLKRPRLAMPDFVRAALHERQLMDAYERRPAYQRNDYIGWICRAKMPATQQKRLVQMLDELRRGDVYMNMAWKRKETT